MRKIAILALAAAFVAGGCCGNRKAAANTEAETTATAVETAAADKQLVGGYTQQRELTEEDMAVFNAATHGMVGVRYTPESVATQVVAGTNYRFVCSATTVTREPETYKAEVVVFKPLPGKGDPKVTAINKL